MSYRPRILIADNDTANVQLLTDICESEDLDVLVAVDGDEALKVVEADRPDLVLLDVMMPGKDGFEVLQALRTNGATADLPVILVTAVSDDDSIRQGYDLGADDYLTKPFKVVELIVRMKNLLGAAAFRRVGGSGATWEVGDRRRLHLQLTQLLQAPERVEVGLVVFQVLGLEQLPGDASAEMASRALSGAAAMLRIQLRGVDSAHIIAPDKVACVLPATDLQASEAVARRLLLGLDRPLEVGQERIQLSVRWAADVALPDDTVDATDLIQRCSTRLSS